MLVGDTFVLSVGVEGMESRLLKAGELTGAEQEDKMAACGLASARPGTVESSLTSEIQSQTLILKPRLLGLRDCRIEQGIARRVCGKIPTWKI